ncbi:MAG: hypothetical protein OIN66_15620 [Candidatus Methanoperedens sp.]|nr:hypothetical protein [Candidatus Methanoperedens sp.]
MYYKKNVIIAVLVNIFLAGSVLGAVPAWDMTFGRTDDESAASVQQTSDDGYIFAGTTSTYGWGERDAWMVKTDYKGTRLWDTAFGGKYYDAATSVQQTPDGGYIVAGTTFTYGAGGSDAWLVKTDANGNKVWDRTFGGVGNESASSVQRTSDDGFIIAGTTFTYGAGGSDAWLIKTDYKGFRMWDRTFGGVGNESASSVQQTPDGGYIIAGTTFTYGAGGSDAWLLKTDSNGTRLWDKTFGGPGNESASSVLRTSDGGYIIAGTTSSYGAGGSDIWLIKTDANGTRFWDRTFGGTGNDSASSVQQTSDGGYIISGTTSSYGAGGSDVWLIKTDHRGNRLWDKTFGGTDNDSAAQVKQSKEGGYVIAGTTSSYGAGGTDAWLVYVLDETTAPPAADNKSIPGFDIITTAVGLLAAVYILDKLKK